MAVRFENDKKRLFELEPRVSAHFRRERLIACEGRTTGVAAVTRIL